MPTIYHSTYNSNADGAVMSGELYMDFIPGETLESAWPTLDAGAKERVCRDTWALVEKLRRVPKPVTVDGDREEEEKDALLNCAADGTPQYHPSVPGRQV